MRNKLVKVFADEAISGFHSDFTNMKIKIEPTFYSKESEEEHSSEEDENTFFARNHHSYRYKPKGGDKEEKQL